MRTGDLFYSHPAWFMKCVQQQWTEVAHSAIQILLLHSVIYFYFQSKKILRSIEKLNFNTSSERKGQDCSQPICLNLVAKATAENSFEI